MRGSRNFRQGGPGQSDIKKALTTFFLSSAYFTEVNWLILKKTIIFQGSRGGPTFSRWGGPIFSRGGGGVGLLVAYRNPYNLIFQGGSGPAVPPLDLPMQSKKHEKSIY